MIRSYSLIPTSAFRLPTGAQAQTPMGRRPHSKKMFAGFTKIVEERIRKAQRKGEFNNLAGAGRPLALEEDRHIAPELRLSYKILKNADCLPPEIELKKEIERTEELLGGMAETAEKYRTLKKLNFLIMKLNATRNSSIEFEVPQRYSASLVNRFESGHNDRKK